MAYPILGKIQYSTVPPLLPLSLRNQLSRRQSLLDLYDGSTRRIHIHIHIHSPRTHQSHPIPLIPTPSTPPHTTPKPSKVSISPHTSTDTDTQDKHHHKPPHKHPFQPPSPSHLSTAPTRPRAHHKGKPNQVPLAAPKPGFASDHPRIDRRSGRLWRCARYVGEAGEARLIDRSVLIMLFSLLGDTYTSLQLVTCTHSSHTLQSVSPIQILRPSRSSIAGIE